ncbi:hypothetical protein OC842_001693 [Tilletia horrida]|uniref:Ribosomal protein L19 n=1 Tax=Tilletia horrida TaxID=155126 RepID=A0AAN6GH36_9BASI|nr:hypothetical protein OC842_001693 [Tilletia horrida]
MASSSRNAALGGLRIARTALRPQARVETLTIRLANCRLASSSASPPEGSATDAGSADAATAAEATPAADPRTTYRFSSSALIRELPPVGINGVTPLQRGSQPKSIYRGVLPRVFETLRTQLDPAHTRTALVDRQSVEQLPPGSVLTIETWTSTAQRGSSSFSGVLIGIRRRGLATSLVLRTLVANKLGVEMRYSLYSPLIKQIKIVARAEASKRQQGLRRTRRAKLYYLRRDDRRLNAVASMVKAQRQAEELAQERAAAAAAASAAPAPGTGAAGKQKKQGQRKGRR